MNRPADSTTSGILFRAEAVRAYATKAVGLPWPSPLTRWMPVAIALVFLLLLAAGLFVLALQQQ